MVDDPHSGVGLVRTGLEVKEQPEEEGLFIFPQSLGKLPTVDTLSLLIYSNICQAASLGVLACLVLDFLSWTSSTFFGWKLVSSENKKRYHIRIKFKVEVP